MIHTIALNILASKQWVTTFAARTGCSGGDGILQGLKLPCCIVSPLAMLCTLHFLLNVAAIFTIFNSLKSSLTSNYSYLLCICCCPISVN